MAKDGDRCIPCEEHARLHSDPLGLGSREPCPQCEEHVELHKRERRITWW